MRLIHPQAPVNGIQPEDVFYALDDQGNQLGSGFVYQFLQGEMYPERPLHQFIQLNAAPVTRTALYGALAARADQLRASYPQYPARLYTQVPPDRQDLLRFFESVGMKNDDSSDLYYFYVPAHISGVREPMGTRFYFQTLENEALEEAFLTRVNQYRIQKITRQHLARYRQGPYFLAAGIYKETNNEPISEILTTGDGDRLRIMSLYTRQGYRRNKMAKTLISLTFQYVQSRYPVSVGMIEGYPRSEAQRGLLRSLNAQRAQQLALLPGIDLPPMQQ